MPITFGAARKSTDRLSAIVQSATRSHQRVNPADILKLPWKWPPLGTQRRIARFLDEKTARIDGLIEKKRELLERLAEKTPSSHHPRRPPRALTPTPR